MKIPISNGEGGALVGGALVGGAQNEVLPQAVLLSGEGGGEEDIVDNQTGSEDCEASRVSMVEAVSRAILAGEV